MNTHIENIQTILDEKPQGLSMRQKNQRGDSLFTGASTSRVGRDRKGFSGKVQRHAAIGATLFALCSPLTFAEFPTNCFWPDGFADDPSGTNLYFPDLKAVYWQTQIRMPPNSHIEIANDFPNARYMSLNTYEQGTPATVLNDTQIEADPGSVNPFRVGADRTATNRSYRVSILNEIEPENPPPNTLYARPRNSLFTYTLDEPIDLILRYYIPDDGAGFGGGVDLVEMEVHNDETGEVTTGQAACDLIRIEEYDPPNGGVLPFPLYQAFVNFGLLRYDGRRNVHPAVNPTFWSKAWNGDYSTFVPFFAGTPLEYLIPGWPTEGGVNQYANLDNSYLTGYVDLNLGPNADPSLNLQIIRAKAPTVPNTFKGDPIMTEGQLRYWSWCINESLASTKTPACVWDEDIPTDVDGYYTVVTGKAENRPSNATSQCGFSWIPFNEEGDGVGRPYHALWIHRHMLPDPAFENAIQRIPDQNSIRESMGDYYPIDRYMDVASFEALGCPAVPPEDRNVICHKGKQTLSLSENALNQHLAHGDTLGACE